MWQDYPLTKNLASRFTEKKQGDGGKINKMVVQYICGVSGLKFFTSQSLSSSFIVVAANLQLQYWPIDGGQAESKRKETIHLARERKISLQFFYQLSKAFVMMTTSAVHVVTSISFIVPSNVPNEWEGRRTTIRGK